MSLLPPCSAARPEVIGLAGLLMVFALGPAASACRRQRADEPREAKSDVTLRSAELASAGAIEPGAPSVDAARRSSPIESVEVPGDRAALVVLGEDTGRPIVYLHGMCSEPRSDLSSWSAGVSEHGTILALVGDTSCPNGPGKATWTTDVRAIDARIDAAIAALGERGVTLDPREVILIGESMGASRAEALASQLPSKYKRLVLVGAPRPPSAKNLGSADAVALLAGEKEWQQNMLVGRDELAARGLSVRFWELPGATHGSYGHDGDRVMAEAVAFVTRGADRQP